MRVVGIDPGVTGAYALLSDEGKLLDVCDLPTLNNEIHGSLLASQLRALAADHIMIERIHAMPKNGSVAAFSQGNTWGAIRTAAQMAQIPWTAVSSASWKAAMGLKAPGLSDAQRKELSRKRAIELFPGFEFFDRKKDHNRAEAALIAAYGHKELA